MTGEQIRSLLTKKGANMSAVAEAAGVSVTQISRVVHGESKSRRIANMIALFLGRRVDDLWPGMYPETYTRRSSSQVRRELAAAARSVTSSAVRGA
jgi:lambda repressor-like predicted transcriptional regulator